MTYEIKYEPVVIGGVTKPKYNIYYTGGDCDGLKEFHSVDGVITGRERLGYLNVNRVKWAEMLRDLLTPGGSIITRMRATAKATLNMSVEYSTVMAVMQNGINGFPDEQTLQTLLRMNWGFTAQEKTTINTYFSNNNFSITVT